jgi:hypothetical protein
MLAEAHNKLKHRSHEIPNLRKWVIELSGQIEQACMALPPRKNSGEWLVEKLKGEPEGDRDYFNMWTRKDIPGLLSVKDYSAEKDGVTRHVTFHESSFGKPGYSDSVVVTEVGRALTDAATEELLANHVPEQLWPHPKWTVFFTVPFNAAFKTIWKFYDNDTEAQAEYDKQEALGLGVTKRPYFHLHDRAHCPPNWRELMNGTLHNPNHPAPAG